MISLEFEHSCNDNVRKEKEPIEMAKSTVICIDEFTKTWHALEHSGREEEHAERSSIACTSLPMPSCSTAASHHTARCGLNSKPVVEEEHAERSSMTCPPLPLTSSSTAASHHTTGCVVNSKLAVEENQVLGSGVNGNVHRATGHDGKDYAVKSFKKEIMSESELRSLQQEVDIHRSLQHPHIVRLEQVIESDSELHLVYECLQGGQLYSRLSSDGALREEDAALAVRQVLLALAYLHAKGVVHRDLKLENLVYADRSFQNLKVIDFGLSVRWDGHTPLTQRCGTPLCVAPEVWQQSYTNQADMWSLGLLTYETLLARSPFPASTQRAMAMSKIGRVDFGSQFRKLSESAQDFLRSLLISVPAERLTAAAALQHPWIRAASSDGASCSAETRLPRALKFRVQACGKILVNTLQDSAWQDQAIQSTFDMFKEDLSGETSASESGFIKMHADKVSNSLGLSGCLRFLAICL